MTPQEAKELTEEYTELAELSAATAAETKELAEKYTTLAALFAVKAAGKELQISWTHTSNGTTFPVWETTSEVPTIESDLSRWRIKPEPRRMWTSSATNALTENETEAEDWRKHGHNLIEWQEVLK